MFKYRIPTILQRLFPNYTWKVKTNDKQLFLTFDDGPHPEITPWVLEHLSIFGAKATFFCVGDNVRKYPKTYRQIIAEGHQTGNHTYHHLKGWTTDDLTYFADVKKAEEYINSNLFRPPYGRIKSSQGAMLNKDYKIIMWDHLSCDYEKKLNIDYSIEQMKKVKNGSIVVFHDSEKSFENLKQLLPQLLAYYCSEGFQLLAIPQN
jgi:peptidoglycan/xylan/chitin deacetylase (PgdA/CDA1 family)